jgi:LemA protein
MSAFLIILAIIILCALWLMGIYNNLIGLKNRVKNAWGQIDVQLQRRYDLIPNLVESVKGYMNFEKSTLTDIVKARSAAMAAREAVEKEGGPTEGSLKQLLGAEASLGSALGRFFAVAEGYPELKSSQNMQMLQEELSSTENKIAFARQAYNDQVMTYNTAQQVFPANFVAATFGHHPADLYEVSKAEAKEPVKVSF